MRLRNSLSILMLGVVLIAGCAGSPTSPPLNFGDSSIGDLMYQAKFRKSAGDPNQALIYLNKLIEINSAEAREQQASLSDYPTKDIYSYRSLNAVGEAYMRKGEILMEMGDMAGAREAFNTLIRDFTYAQYHFAERHKNKPAEDAERRLGELKAAPN